MALAQGLAASSKLKQLNIASNMIGDEGCAAFGDALCKTRAPIEGLYFDNNPSIGDGGIMGGLSHGLSRSTTIKTILFNLCSISDLGASALASALVRNTSLKDVNLSATRVSDVGALELMRAMLATRVTMTPLHQGQDDRGSSLVRFPEV